MSRRVCTTQPGFGTCCQAAQAGRLNQPIQVQLPNGSLRCAMCKPVTKRKGGQGFQFRFQKDQACGIASGCPVVGQTSGVNLPQVFGR